MIAEFLARLVFLVARENVAPADLKVSPVLVVQLVFLELQVPLEDQEHLGQLAARVIKALKACPDVMDPREIRVTKVFLADLVKMVFLVAKASLALWDPKATRAISVILENVDLKVFLASLARKARLD